MNKQKNALIIFLKFPEPGKVKTRLAESIGNKKAANLYSAIASYVVDRLSYSANYETLIFYSGDKSEDIIKNWLGNKSLKMLPQYGISLGEKISASISTCLSLGFQNMVVIGTDCIDISQDDINNSLSLISGNEYDLILGPSKDGGYYLLSVNKRHQYLFNDIEWSTSRVLSQTIKIAEEYKLNYKLLEIKNDIDEIDDLELDIISATDPKLAIEIGSILN